MIRTWRRVPLAADNEAESATATVNTTSSTPAQRLLLPPRVGRALVIGCFAVVVEGVVGSVGHATDPKALAAWSGAVLFIGAYIFAYLHPTPVSFGLSGAGAALLSFAITGNTSFVAVIMTIATAATQLQRRYSAPIAALTGLAFVIAVLTTGHGAPKDVLSPMAGLAFTYIAADSLRRLRVEQQRARELLQEVIAGRDARIEAAALGERARLAREIHDVLAHTLSALSIQLQSAHVLAEQRPGDPSLLATIERAGGLAREGLVEARRAVGSLRDDSLPGPDLLPRLAEEFERDTGIPVYLTIEGTARDLLQEGRLALYRVAQEALTNVRKHADADSIDVILRYGAHDAELTVENKGRARRSSIPGGGFGLNGMRERAELLGGKLEAGPTEHGFCVRLWILG